jgi:hypothetical protein
MGFNNYYYHDKREYLNYRLKAWPFVYYQNSIDEILNVKRGANQIELTITSNTISKLNSFESKWLLL